MSYDKHAYLIIAHNEPELLYKLLSALDYEYNDIFLHLDKKTTCFSEKQITNICNNSKLYFVERKNITWGGYSGIEAELRLLEMAINNGNYAYYHLLSGVDIPLKNQSYIHEFFSKNSGKEFIHFCDEEFNRKQRTRYSRYHLFQEHIGRSTNTLLYYCEKISMKVQGLLGVDRSKKEWSYKGGSNWFSITDSLARYVVGNKKIIEKRFRYSLACDEFFLQTLVYNSYYYNNVYRLNDIPSYITCMRYIDWKRGNPYVYEEQDVDELLNSGYLFARKFSTATEDQRRCAETIYCIIEGEQNERKIVTIP